MAQDVAEGVKEIAGVQALIKEADQVFTNDLINADAPSFGSPTYFSYLAGIMKAILDKARSSRSELSGKPTTAFVSGGCGGSDRHGYER